MKKKRLMKIATLGLAAAMTIGTTVPAFASSITLPSSTGHTYDVYQIFTGTVADGVMSDIKWGQNGTGTQGQLVDAAILKNFENANSQTSDSAKLAVIENYASLVESNAFKANVTEGTKLTDVPDGYYLVTDDGSSAAAGNKNESVYLVQVINGDITMTAKVVGTPDFDKDVQDETADAASGEADAQGTTENNTDGYADTADHEIGEVFNFRLTADLTDVDRIDDYSHYYLQFKDTMSSAITYNGNLKVYVNGTEVSSGFTTSNPTVGTAGQSFTVTINDLVSLIGNAKLSETTVEVVYEAYLNETALVTDSLSSTDANVNKGSIVYSTNPDYDGKGSADTDETEEDYNYVFTYKVENTKVDGATAQVDENGNTIGYETTLSGAEFTLLDSDKNDVTLKAVYTDSSKTTVSYYAVDKENKLSGDNVATVTTMVSASDGTFNIQGLDAGTYYLHETKAPTGYNTLTSDITLTIDGTHAESTDGKSASVTHTKATTSATTIENTKGTGLPSTGGMGTMMFYALGGALAIGAGSTLVVKKRMKKNS